MVLPFRCLRQCNEGVLTIYVGVIKKEDPRGSSFSLKPSQRLRIECGINHIVEKLEIVFYVKSFAIRFNDAIH